MVYHCLVDAIAVFLERYLLLLLRPDMKVCHIGLDDNHKEVLVFPDSINKKLYHNKVLAHRWQMFSESNVAKFGRATQVVHHGKTKNEMNKPDFTQNAPDVPLPDITDTTKKADDLEGTRVFSYKMQAGNHILPMHVCKEGDAFSLWVDGSELEKDIELPALGTLLMGFGVGKWASTSAQPHGIRYEIKDDTTYRTVKAEDGSKKTARVCEHLEELKTTGKGGTLSNYGFEPNDPRNHRQADERTLHP